MRPPSLLVPVGGVTAAVGISLPIVTVGARLRGTTLLEGDFDASSGQRAYLLAVAVVAAAAALLPLVMPRLKAVGYVLAVAATAVAVLASVRGWVIVTDGPDALQAGDISFLQRSALEVLDRLEAAGILVVDPARGLWVLSAGAGIMLVGLLLSLRPEKK